MKINKGIYIVLFAVALASSKVSAEVKVIAHPSMQSKIDKETIAAVFLGKAKTLPNGTAVVPLDQEEGEKVRDEFYIKVTKKSPAKLKAYWSRLIFTGKGYPSKVVSGDSQVLSRVSSDPHTIGYVSGDTDTSGVKVLLTIR